MPNGDRYTPVPIVGGRATHQILTETPPGGETGLGAAVFGSTLNVLSDRWWKKEAEEFQAGPMEKLKGSLAQIGELANDDNYDDIGSMWSMMQSALIDFQNEATKYARNPYINNAASAAMKNLMNSFGELTQGIQQVSSAAAQRETIAESRELRPLKKAQAEAGVETERAEARRTKAQARLLEKEVAKEEEANVTTFGAVRGDPSTYVDQARFSQPYQVGLANIHARHAAAAWTGPIGEEFRKASPTGLAKYEDFLAWYQLPDEAVLEYDQQVARQIVGELNVHPDYQQAILQRMVTVPASLKAAKAATTQKITHRLDLGSRELNAVLLQQRRLDEVPEGRMADILPSLAAAPPTAPIKRILSAYEGLRNAGISHEEAKAQILSSGQLNFMAEQLFDTSLTPSVQGARNFVQELSRVLDAVADRYDISKYEETVGGLWPAIKGRGEVSWHRLGRALSEMAPTVGELLAGEKIIEPALAVGTPQGQILAERWKQQLEKETR